MKILPVSHVETMALLASCGPCDSGQTRFSVSFNLGSYLEKRGDSLSISKSVVKIHENVGVRS